MNKGKLLGLLIAATAFTTLTYAAENNAAKKGDKDDMAGEVSVVTAYELKTKKTARHSILEQVEMKLKENAELLKGAECVEAKKGRTAKGGRILSYSCLKPTAQTDEFFRSLLALAPTEDCRKGAPPMTMTAYSYSLPSNCKLWYCCGVTSAVPCLKINPTKPCTSCADAVY